VRCGLVVPFFDAAEVAEAAALAEDAGWDGVFLAEAVWGVDAWVALTAAAMRTGRIRLGTMLTPLPRIKPWDLASRAATLDRLSGGRVQLAVGLGALHPGWTAFEPDSGRRERALLLEEGLAVYDGLMRGQPFSFAGRRYTVRPTEFFPPDPPVQRPRVPVWVVGAYPSERSLGRAARWDGLVPNVLGEHGVRGPASPEELATILAATRRLREAAGLPWDGYDAVAEGTTPAGDRAAAATTIAGWARAGATWWIESDWSLTRDADGWAALRRRIQAGPPAR
jgi:alkanesulfonate monooxygenase SsuD/methylene tetrahydromethanopterin reductase-like flavin-dependent oxidoreductase (luciferase family)